MLPDEKQEIEAHSGDFDLRGYEIARSQFFNQSFSANMLHGVSKLVFCYGDDLKDEIFKEKPGRISVKELSRTARDRRAGSLGYAEAILLIYNKKTQHPLRFEKLYTKKGKRSAKIEEQESTSMANEEYPEPSIPSDDSIGQMDLFNFDTHANTNE